jgi:hypothetical protein
MRSSGNSPSFSTTANATRAARNSGSCRLLFTIALLIAMTAGCSSEASSDEEYITAAEATEQYLDEAKKWTLAPGWSWPISPGYAATADDGRAVFYGPNIGRIDASYYWHCTWGRTLLAADPTERSTAAEQVLRVRDSPYYLVGLLPEDREPVEDALRALEAGDESLLRPLIELNCPEVSAP